MNVALRILVVAALACLLAGTAFAQEGASEDDVLQRYVLALENLDGAVTALPDDGVAARDRLDQAFSALLTLSRGSSAMLVESLDRVFGHARTAIENESPTDLRVQAHVLRGGFQRILYEAALEAAVEDDVSLARERLMRLARDVGLGDARTEQVRQVAEVGPLRQILEAGTAEQIAARMDALAAPGAAADRNDAYVRLARAYGDFLLVQDSHRLEAPTHQRFLDAATALVDADEAAFAEATGALADTFGQLASQADRAFEQGVEEPAPGASPPADGLAAGAEDAAPEADDAPAEAVSEAGVDAEATTFEPAVESESAAAAAPETEAAAEAEAAPEDGQSGAAAPEPTDAEAAQAEADAAAEAGPRPERRPRQRWRPRCAG